MPISVRRFVPIAVIAAALCFTIVSASAPAPDPGVPHLIHAYEGWVALGVVVLALVGAGVLVRRSLRR